MRKRIIDNLTITANHTTEWINIEGANNLFAKSFNDFSIQVNWLNGSGVANGTVALIGTISGLETVLDTANITSLSNTADVLQFNCKALVSAIKLKFTMNSLTALTINADMEISE